MANEKFEKETLRIQLFDDSKFSFGRWLGKALFFGLRRCNIGFTEQSLKVTTCLPRLNWSSLSVISHSRPVLIFVAKRLWMMWNLLLPNDNGKLKNVKMKLKIQDLAAEITPELPCSVYYDRKYF